MTERWNLIILIITCTLVFGFITGYVYRDRFTNQYQKERLAADQPDISGQILNASIQEILQPKTSGEATTQTAEVYAFTGYVRAISADNITVDRPDDTTTGEDRIDFILTDTTVYADTKTETDDIGMINKIETPLAAEDISSGDIVTVYSAEDIKTAVERHVTKVERLTAATDTVAE